MMHDIYLGLADDASIALITEWISKMQPERCP